MQYDHVLKKLNFNLLTPRVHGGVYLVFATMLHVAAPVILIYCTSVCICYHVAAFAIPFDMQHDNVLKKFNFNLLTPRALGVCRENICYHVAAFVIPFKLICNMTMF